MSPVREHIPDKAKDTSLAEWGRQEVQLAIALSLLLIIRI
jgi:hypothetical protein